MSLDFINGIYQYQANTSTSRNTTVATSRDTTQSTTRDTTLSTSRSTTEDSTANTTRSTTVSTSKSTTTTFDTTFSTSFNTTTSYTTSYNTTFSTSFTTSYSTSVPSTREPGSGWYGFNSSYQWVVSLGTANTIWAGTQISNVLSNPQPGAATSFNTGGYTYLRGPLTNSDINIKTEIEPARNYLSAVNDIPVHKFKYKSNVEDEPILGVMAQEVEAVAPELMTKKANGIKAVYPQQIQYAMLKAIQELTAKVEKLEDKLK